jgi:hypothetical protein
VGSLLAAGAANAAELQDYLVRENHHVPSNYGLFHLFNSVNLGDVLASFPVLNSYYRMLNM